MKNRSLWISGLAAGLFMLVGPVIATLASLPNLPGDGSTLGAGISLLCFYFIWVVISPIFGVWLYQFSGSTVFVKDGLFIGAISAIFAITLVLIYGLVQFVTQPESILKDTSFAGITEFVGMIANPASTILFAAGFGGFLGSVIFRKKIAK